MSTTYTEPKTQPVVVSVQRRRSPCGCLAVGCGCVVVVLIIISIVLAIMWPRIKPRVASWFTNIAEQALEPMAQNEAHQIADDPRVRERLGEPIKLTRDESVPFT